jgi:hypothetical protein
MLCRHPARSEACCPLSVAAFKVIGIRFTSNIRKGVEIGMSTCTTWLRAVPYCEDVQQKIVNEFLRTAFGLRCASRSVKSGEWMLSVVSFRTYLPTDGGEYFRPVISLFLLMACDCMSVLYCLSHICAFAPILALFPMFYIGLLPSPFWECCVLVNLVVGHRSCLSLINLRTGTLLLVYLPSMEMSSPSQVVPRTRHRNRMRLLALAA